MVHQFTFDTAGRLAADTVTDLGSSGIVDGSVRRIGRTYDDVGRLETLTSYSDTSGTTVVNHPWRCVVLRQPGIHIRSR